VPTIFKVVVLPSRGKQEEGEEEKETTFLEIGLKMIETPTSPVCFPN